MGWLKEAVTEAGLGGFPAAAERLAAAVEDPSGGDPAKRVNNLANNLRKGDKGDGQWWLRKGRPCLTALADLLPSWTEKELMAQFSGDAQRAGRRSKSWGFAVFPELRRLDLEREALPPGLPAELDPHHVQERRSWWLAPPGSGQGLARRWAAERLGWTVIEAENWEEALGRLPVQGRCYVALGSTAGMVPEDLQGVGPGLQIWVEAEGPPWPPVAPPDLEADTDGAGPAVPEAGALGLPPGWCWVICSEPAEWLSEMVGWIAARVAAGAGFDARTILELDGAGLGSLVSGFDDALALFSLWNEVGTQALVGEPDGSGWDAGRALRAWLQLKAGPDTTKRRAGELEAVLVGMETGRILQGGAARAPSGAWQGWVSQEHAPALSNAKISAMLEEVGGRDRAKAALARPEAGAWVSALADIAVLRPERSGGADLHIGPPVVAALLRSRVVERLVAGSLDELAGGLLSPDHSDGVLDGLVARTLAEPGWFGPLLGELDERTPEGAVVLDGLFRAAGLAHLNGAAVPSRMLEALWSRQMRLAAKRSANHPAFPVLMLAPRRASQDETGRGLRSQTRRVVGCTALAGWYLTALAISRDLQDVGVELPVGPLTPWAGLDSDEDRRTLASALDDVSSAVGAGGQAVRAGLETAWAAPARALVGELVDRIGPVERHGRPSPLVAPEMLVSLALGDDQHELTHTEERLVRLETGLGALAEACERRGVSLELVVGWCWAQWAHKVHQTPPVQWASSGKAAEQEWAKELWASLPPELVRGELAEKVAALPMGCLEALAPAVWRRWACWYGKEQGYLHSGRERVWEAIPKDVAFEMLEEGTLTAYDHQARAAFWTRFPTAMVDLLEELAAGLAAESQNEAGVDRRFRDMLHSSPEDRREVLLELARTWLADPVAHPGADAEVVQRWLMRLIGGHSQGWRTAWQLLMRAGETDGGGFGD